MSGITVHVTHKNRDLSWPPPLNSLSLHSRGGCMWYGLFRAGYAPKSLSKRAANLSLGTAPRLLCLKSQHTLLLPLPTWYFSLINQKFLMFKIIKEKKWLPIVEYIDSHHLGSCPASSFARQIVKDFYLTMFLIALVCCGGLTNEEQPLDLLMVCSLRIRGQ